MFWRIVAGPDAPEDVHADVSAAKDGNPLLEVSWQEPEKDIGRNSYYMVRCWLE